MLEVAIPNDILKYETKIIGPLSKKELICVSAAGLLSLGFYKVANGLMPIDMMGFVIIMICLPFLICGWCPPPHGIPVEKFAIMVFKTMFLYPRKRLYKIENNYASENLITDSYEGIPKDVLKEAIAQFEKDFPDINKVLEGTEKS